MTNWWTRPCGGFDVLKQALPIIISGGSISLMNFTDRMFLMWYDADAMTASMQGGMLFWSSVAIPAHIAAFVTTFVAQYNGSGNLKRIGTIVWQGIWFGCVMMPMLFLLYPFLTNAFACFGHSETLIPLEQTYFYWMLWSSAAVISGESAASFFRGRGKMQVEMYTNVFCVALNIALDAVLIFGKFGFPEWGLAGAAIATVIAQWTRFFIYVVLMYYADKGADKFNIFGGIKPDFPLLGRLFYYGVPAGFYTFVDTISFTVFIMVIGGLSEAARNATTIAFTMNSLTFIPLSGIGIVVTSMVGNQLGNNRPDLARRVTMTATVFGVIYSGFFAVLFFAVPDFLLSGFAAFSPPEDFAAVHDLCVTLMLFLALYLCFDSVSIIFCSALRGAGDTYFIAWMVLVLAPLYPLACFIGVRYFDLGILWCWSVVTAAVFAYLLAFSLRYRSKAWESKRVIEQEIKLE
ncbi:MAG: MATE family efflux transporter [Planctomycetaceae bacterium]|jgi:MATE family multidrug resistance protein|nr:MATE family efflux transporter [Planctomycetaceae bacterium]